MPKKPKPKPTFKDIPLDLIDGPKVEMRSYLEEEKFDELIASIKKVGVIEPIVVREKGDRYEVVVGDRRYEAAKSAGLATIPAVVKHLEDREVSNYMLSENLIREDPNPYDTALLLSRILKEEGCQQVELGERIGWSQQKVSYYMEVLKMPEDLQEALRANIVGLHQARQLNKIDESTQRVYYTKLALDTGASVRTISIWVQDYLRTKFPERVLPAPATGGNTIGTPPPMEARCFCCGEVYPSESMMIVRIDPKCHSVMKEIAKEVRELEREQSMAEEEAGQGGPETSPVEGPGNSGKGVQG